MYNLLDYDFLHYKDKIDFCKDELCNSVFLITGATGLIGSLLCKFLIRSCSGIKIIAPIRNIAKADAIFSQSERLQIEFKVVNIEDCDYSNFAQSCDYIIHCAAPTASLSFINNPVETFESIVNGTAGILKFAKVHHNIKSIVFLSSLEVYGDISEDNLLIDENSQGYLKIDSVRSSYPMAKRAAENLCYLYANEYDIPVKIARLTQIAGAGVDFNDNRVLTQFCRCKVLRKPIVLHSSGLSSRPYCYTMDAITAILTILINGEKGIPYNVANDDTYISAYDLAKKISDIEPASELRIAIDNTKGYANVTYHHLTSNRLRSLGWAPLCGLDDIINRLIGYLSDCYERNQFE